MLGFRKGSLCRILYKLRCFRYNRMPRFKVTMVKSSLSVFITIFFLVLLQIAIVYGATSFLPSSLSPPSQSVGSANVQKVAQLGAPVFLAPYLHPVIMST